jgi:hypothetical protein
MKRRTFKDWDKPIMAGFPVGLYMHPTGMNRAARRNHRQHKNDPTMPSSMVPAVKRLVRKTKDSNEIPEVRYVAAW